MRKGYPASVALLVAAVVALTACSGGKPVDPGPDAPSLAEVRRNAEAAFDVKLSSQQRQQSRNDTMQSLLAFLRRPESIDVSKADWERPIAAGAGTLRYHQTGKMRLYALTIPGSGIVPPGERVAVQYVNGSSPQAFELEVMPGGQLVGARSLDDKGLMAAFSLARGGGYIAHHLRDSKTGEFRADATPLRNLPSILGDIRFEFRKEFMLVDVPVDAAWQPQFDAANPNRFYMNADVAVEYKQGKFQLLDERNFTAFQGFVAASNGGLPEKERKDAWDKATRKLPAYLQSMESLADDLAGKLPTGAHFAQDAKSGVMARIISIPAPAFSQQPSFTVIQHRTGDGMPSAHVVETPGVMESFQVVVQKGQFGLLVTSVLAADKGQSRVVTLMRETTAGGWEPAPDWYGFMPTGDGVPMQRQPGSANLTVKGAVTLQPDGSLNVCEKPDACFAMTWVGGRLTGAGWLGRQVQQLAGPVAPSQVTAVVNLIKQYMLTPETADATGTELAASLGAGVQGWDPVAGARVLALPMNGVGVVPAFVQVGNTVAVEMPAAGAIEQWADVRAVQASGATWLLLLGRKPNNAAAVLYQVTAQGPQPVDALTAKVDRPIGLLSRISYTPGQKEPVRGVYASGPLGVQAQFTPDGSGVSFCEQSSLCTTYRFEQGWVLK